jgi:hypothetical protein
MNKSNFFKKNNTQFKKTFYTFDGDILQFSKVYDGFARYEWNLKKE